MQCFRASLVLGLIWALWHVPAIFFWDTYLNMTMHCFFPAVRVYKIFGPGDPSPLAEEVP